MFSNIKHNICTETFWFLHIIHSEKAFSYRPFLSFLFFFPFSSFFNPQYWVGKSVRRYKLQFQTTSSLANGIFRYWRRFSKSIILWLDKKKIGTLAASASQLRPTLIRSFTLRLPSVVGPFPLKQELNCGELSSMKSLLSRTLTSIKTENLIHWPSTLQPTRSCLGHRWMDFCGSLGLCMDLTDHLKAWRRWVTAKPG